MSEKEIESLIAIEIEWLENCENPVAWDGLCDIIKSRRGGAYPPDWFEKVLMPGGISSRLKEKWDDPEAFDLKILPM